MGLPQCAMSNTLVTADTDSHGFASTCLLALRVVSARCSVLMDLCGCALLLSTASMHKVLSQAATRGTKRLHIRNFNASFSKEQKHLAVSQVCWHVVCATAGGSLTLPPGVYLLQLSSEIVSHHDNLIHSFLRARHQYLSRQVVKQRARIKRVRMPHCAACHTATTSPHALLALGMRRSKPRSRFRNKGWSSYGASATKYL